MWLCVHAVNAFCPAARLRARSVAFSRSAQQNWKKSTWKMTWNTASCQWQACYVFSQLIFPHIQRSTMTFSSLFCVCVELCGGMKQILSSWRDVGGNWQLFNTFKSCFALVRETLFTVSCALSIFWRVYVSYYVSLWPQIPFWDFPLYVSTHRCCYFSHKSLFDSYRSGLLKPGALLSAALMDKWFYWLFYFQCVASHKCKIAKMPEL